MKRKIVIIILALCVMVNVSSDSIEDQFDYAKELYVDGQVNEAISALNRLKNDLNELISSLTEEEYEFVNWDRVKLMPKDYSDKKIQLVDRFTMITTSGKIALRTVGTVNTYEETIIEDVLKLEERKDYLFFGVVKEDWMGPYLHIQSIKKLD